jgi:exo-beta-1,3-glucanase (GH17 family)
MTNLVQTTNYRTIMVYSLDIYIAQIAESLGVKVLGIIYLTADWTSNGNNINMGIQAATQYPNTVVGISCGNEAGANNGATPSTAAFINNCISSVRQAGVKQPVGVIDTPSSWLGSGNTPWTDVAKNVDWIGANIYPWFDNMFWNPPFQCNTPQNVGQMTYQMYSTIETMYPNVPIFLTEAGWPTSPTGSAVASPPNQSSGVTCTTASAADQRMGAQNIVNVFRQNKKPMNLFSSYQEAWKAQNSYSFEQFWGVCSGTPPYSCANAPK